MVDLCAREPWKICMGNVWKFEHCLKREKQKMETTAKRAWSTSTAGFTPGNDLVIICLPKVTRFPNRYFSPLSFLWFLSWPLLTSNIINNGGFVWKGTMENLCVKTSTLSHGGKKTKKGNNCQKALKHMCMAGFTPGNDIVIICLPN